MKIQGQKRFLIGNYCHKLTTILLMNIKENTMPMNVNLTPYLEKMVRDKVSSGLYTSASEVIREALRLMDEQDSIRKTRLDLLRQDIHAGLESGAAMDWNPNEIKKAGRARSQKQAGR